MSIMKGFKMLTLGVKNERKVVLTTCTGEEISVYVRFFRGKCKLSIDAPQSVNIMRQEVYEEKMKSGSH